MNNFKFKFNGTLIEDANTDETGRFEVNPIKYYGQEYIDAYVLHKYKNIEAALRSKFKDITKIYDWQDTSGSNDLCMSISAIDILLNNKEYTIQVYVPNHIIKDEEDQINTYGIWIDEEESYYLNKQGEKCFFDNEFKTSEQVTQAISLFIARQNEN